MKCENQTPLPSCHSLDNIFPQPWRETFTRKHSCNKVGFSFRGSRITAFLWLQHLRLLPKCLHAKQLIFCCSFITLNNKHVTGSGTCNGNAERRVEETSRSAFDSTAPRDHTTKGKIQSHSFEMEMPAYYLALMSHFIVSGLHRSHFTQRLFFFQRSWITSKKLLRFNLRGNTAEGRRARL